MKKKFKRSVKTKTAAKIKRRRIMSAFLAASVFVSGGVFSNFHEIGFTVVAEDEDEIDVATPNPQAETPENQDNAGTPNPQENNKPPDNGELNNADDDNNYHSGDDSKQTDGGITPLAEEGGDETGGGETGNGGGETGNGGGETGNGGGETGNGGGTEGGSTPTTPTNPKPTDSPTFCIRVQPERDDFNMECVNWENNNNYTEYNFPYIARESILYNWKTVTVCGVTSNIVEVDNCTEEASEQHIKYTDSNGVEKCYHSTTADGKIEMYLLDDSCKQFSDYKSTAKYNVLNSSNVRYEVVEEEWSTGWENKDEGKWETVTGTHKVVRVYMDVTFSGNFDNYNAITGKVVFNDGTKTDYSDWQQLYVSFRPENSYIQVYTEVTNRDMNKVHEYVNDANLGVNSKRHVKGTTIENSEDTPYLLLNGDSVFIRGTSGEMILPSDGNTPNVDTDGLGIKNWDGTEVLRTAAAAEVNDIKNAENGFIKLTVNGDVNDVYHLDYKTNATDFDGNTIYDRFYFKIYNNTSKVWPPNYWDHSDIEIVDSGTYKIETTEADGKTYVVEYDIEVTDVNKCEIYGYTGERPNPDGDPTGSLLTIRNQFWEELDDNGKAHWNGIFDKIKNGEELTPEEKAEYDNAVNECKLPREMNYIPASDYWKDPAIAPGDDQFELTSKYQRSETEGPQQINGVYESIVDDKGNRLLDENNKPRQGRVLLETIDDNLRYEMADVGGAKFYLQLYLKPVACYYYEAGVEKTETNRKKMSDEKKEEYFKEMTMSNAEFPMSYQSVLDAFNKCPDNSGLDFTIKSDISYKVDITPTQAQFKAQKSFINKYNDAENKDLKAGQFKFQLYYIPDAGETPDLIETVYNDSNGLITFTKQPFITKGDYHYQIKEVIGNDILITYDESVIDVFVSVVADPNDATKLVADVKYERDGVVEITPTFTNKYKIVYELPSTGGTGVYIYIIGGVGLMLSAVVMYRRKRKEE